MPVFRKKIPKHTKSSKNDLFKSEQNKTGCEFSRKPSFSKTSARIQLRNKRFVCICNVCIALKKISSKIRFLSCFVRLKSVRLNLWCFGTFRLRVLNCALQQVCWNQVSTPALDPCPLRIRSNQTTASATTRQDAPSEHSQRHKHTDDYHLLSDSSKLPWSDCVPVARVS